MSALVGIKVASRTAARTHLRCCCALSAPITSNCRGQWPAHVRVYQLKVSIPSDAGRSMVFKAREMPKFEKVFRPELASSKVTQVSSKVTLTMAIIN